MGLAASQARLLSITARKADCEFQSMTLSHEKIALARNMERLSDEYQNALKQTKLVYDYYGSGTSQMDLTYGLLMSPSSYNDYAPKLITNSQNKVVLDSKYAAAAAIAGIPVEGYMGTPSSDVRNRFVEALVDSNIISASTGMAIQNVTYNNQVGLGNSMVASQSTTVITYEDLLNELKANTISTSEYGLTLGGFYALQDNNDFADWYYLTARDRLVNQDFDQDHGDNRQDYDCSDMYGWDLINEAKAYAGGGINSQMGTYDGLVVRSKSTGAQKEIYRDPDFDLQRTPTSADKNSRSINLIDLLTGDDIYNISLQTPDEYNSMINEQYTHYFWGLGHDAGGRKDAATRAITLSYGIGDGSPYSQENLRAALFNFYMKNYAHEHALNAGGTNWICDRMNDAENYAREHANDPYELYEGGTVKGYEIAYSEYWLNNFGYYTRGHNGSKAWDGFANNGGSKGEYKFNRAASCWSVDEWMLWHAVDFSNDLYVKISERTNSKVSDGNSKCTDSHAKDIAYLQQLIVGDESEGNYSFLNWMVDQFQTVLGGRDENNMALQYAYNAVYDLLYPNEDVQEAAASVAADTNPGSETKSTYQSIVTSFNNSVDYTEQEADKYLGFVDATAKGRQGVSINLNNLAKVFLTAYVEYMGGVENSNYQYNVGAVKGNNLYDPKNSDKFTILGSTEVDDSTDNLTATYYDMLFNQICVNGWTQNSKVSDSEYMQEMLKSGTFFISSINNDNNYYQNAYSSDVYVSEITDSDAVAQAEAKYNAEKAKIESKENIIDMKMKNLDTEVSALTTEYDTTKNLINKTIEKTLKRYEA